MIRDGTARGRMPRTVGGRYPAAGQGGEFTISDLGFRILDCGGRLAVGSLGGVGASQSEITNRESKILVPAYFFSGPSPFCCWGGGGLPPSFPMPLRSSGFTWAAARFSRRIASYT